MDDRISILNFDHVYQNQSFYVREKYDWIDLSDIPNTNLFCEQDALKRIAARLKERPPSFLRFIGSGNYHYITYLFLSRIQKPFSLVLIDHHTDTLPSPSDALISCGSWVLQSLQHLPMLKRVLIIGADTDGYKHIPPSIAKKVKIMTKYEPLTAQTDITGHIDTDSVYISIDKDVLSKKEAITSWDQGTLTLKALANILKAIFQSKKVEGVDVCGEYPMNPSNEYTKLGKQAALKNNRANKFILDKVKLYFYSHNKKLTPALFQKANDLSQQI